MLTFTENDIIGLDRVRVPEDFGAVPCWRVRMKWGRNWTPMDTDLGAVTDSGRATLAQEWYTAIGDADSAIQTAHPLAPDVTIESYFSDAVTDPEAEGLRQFDLRSVQRDRLQFHVEMTAANLALDLGDYIEIEHSRFGLSGGKNFAIVSIEPKPRDGLIELGCWG